MPECQRRVQQVDNLIRLLKKGDTSSLAQLRNLIGIKRSDLSSKIGVSEQKLELWENGEEQPSSLHYSLWKIRLGDYLDKKIARYLGTEDNEVINEYLALIWGLVD